MSVSIQYLKKLFTLAVTSSHIYDNFNSESLGSQFVIQLSLRDIDTDQ